jgi:protein-disulfide isomerase
MTSSKQTVFIFKNIPAEYATLAALLNLCAPEENHLIQTKKIFSLMRTIFDQDEKTNSQNDK